MPRFEGKQGALRAARRRASSRKGKRKTQPSLSQIAPRRARARRPSVAAISPKPNGPVRLYWWDGMGGKNFGDVLSRYIVRAMAGRSVVHARRAPRLLAVGSILRLAKPGDIIWGSGLSRPSPVCPNLGIFALRGPLTRKIASDQFGYTKAPEIYGDPALLLPRLLDASQVARKDRVGFVPHYVDRDHHVTQSLRSQGFSVIDVLAPPLEVVRRIVSCSFIYSSSLHGVIVAEAFGIPAVWVELSDGVVGGGFKFRDYYLASGRQPPPPLNWRRKADKLGVRELAPEISYPDLDALVAAFPVPRRGRLRQVRL